MKFKILYRPSLAGGVTFAAILTLVMPQPCRAQVLYGSVVGTVRDQSGAAIPGADVTVVNEQTNRTRRGIADEVGNFSFPAVQTGTVTVKVSMPGFKEYIKMNIPVTVNTVTRVPVVLQVGEVSEQITVRAETAILQTDRAEVSSQITEEKLENLPVPLGRNYQDLFKALPGFTPPQEVHSIQSNPARARRFNVNGVSNSINTTRIDGATTISPSMPHITGYVPALESIETVNVVTGNYDAEQGLAGGAAITVQLKSGTNDFHGSGFFSHHDNVLRAKRFLYPYPEDLEKGKFIFNQYGGTLGGPIKKDKLFFFASFEGTDNYRHASRIGDVPSAAVRSGDFSSFDEILYDPSTGNPDGTGRLPFPNNVIPDNRISPIAKKIIADLPLPNIPGADAENSNYIGTGNFVFERRTLDTKIDWTATNNLNMFGRLSTLGYDVVQPTLFGKALVGDGLQSHGGGGGNPGTGQGTTWNFSYGANIVVSPTFVIDANFGFAHFVTDSRNQRYGENVGLDHLGIPGTNGPEIWASGYPNFDLDGYNDLGIQQDNMPYLRKDDQWQYTANFNWTRGSHEIRWGLDLNRQDINHTEAGGPSGQGAQGRFDFTESLTSLCLQPDGEGGCEELSDTDSKQSFAALLLGMPQQVGKEVITLFPYSTRNWLTAFYIRDRWQVTPKLTLSYGTRWEYFPIPTREDRGTERYDVDRNIMLVGGLGDIPEDMGVEVSKAMFAPRLGIAYRATDDFVIRAGYGLTNDPYPLARRLQDNYPILVGLVVESEHSWLPVTTLAEGIPPVPIPTIENGLVEVDPRTAAIAVPEEFDRGYVQSWNFTLQKELFSGFVGEAGYVATRSIRQLGRKQLNYADIGTGSSGRQLFKRFGRTASTQILAPVGNTQYDSMQLRLQRRFTDGFSLDMSYVWGKTLTNAAGGSDSDGGLKINIPEFHHLNRQLAEIDRTHNFQVMSIWQLPFGRGMRWLNDGGFWSKVLGGWQVNNLISRYSGSPFDIDTPDGELDAPGNDQRPDLVAPVRILGGIGPDQPYYDPASFAEPEGPRFGTAPFGVLRSPPIFNWDFGVFRQFHITENVNLQFRMEAFNFTNTPHFDDGPADEIGDDDFLTFDEAADERRFRFGLRLAF